MAKYRELGKLDINTKDIPNDWYSDTFTVSTAGGDGYIWERKEKGKIQYTISTGVIKEVQAKFNSFKFRFKRHYVLTQKGEEEIMAKLVEDKL